MRVMSEFVGTLNVWVSINTPINQTWMSRWTLLAHVIGKSDLSKNNQDPYKGEIKIPPPHPYKRKIVIIFPTRESHFYIHWWSNDTVVRLPTWCIISRRTINQRLQSRLPKAWRLPRSKLSDERSTYNYDQDFKMIMSDKILKSPLVDD